MPNQLLWQPQGQWVYYQPEVLQPTRSAKIAKTISEMRQKRVGMALSLPLTVTRSSFTKNEQIQMQQFSGLVLDIVHHLDFNGLSKSFAPASMALVEETESQLGFAIPDLLKLCYTQIGNGGFGPGYGLIGVESGYSSDFGFLLETLQVLKEGQEFDGNEWPIGLLPICEWGCNIFSCVQCLDKNLSIFDVDNSKLSKRPFTLTSFFQTWIDGKPILAKNNRSTRGSIRSC